MVYRKLDIIFGVLGCILGAISLCFVELFGNEKDFEYRVLYLPTAWIACMAGVFFFRQHPWKKLWWVWLSAFPNLYYMAGLFSIIIRLLAAFP